jgi:hypothetical protein
MSRTNRVGARHPSRPHHGVDRTRHGRSRRGAIVLLAGLAMVVSGLFAPVAAQSSSTSRLLPQTARVARGEEGRTVGAGVRVDARQAARAAADAPRATHRLDRLPVDLGARPSTKAVAPSSKGALSGGTAAAAVGPAPRVPGTLEQQVTTSFPGIAEAGTCNCEPPDPWIAVSPTYVVQSTNGMIRISNRAGTQLVSMPSWALFAVPVNRLDADPRILWDAVHGRWVGIITTFNAPAFTDNGLRLAVSETADPTGAWIVYPIETFEFLPDYPAISSSSDKIVLSSNDFSFLSPTFTFEGGTLYVVDWANILAGTSLFVGADFFDASAAHFRPAQMLSAGSNVPVVFEAASGLDAVPVYVEIAGLAHTFNYVAASDLNADFGTELFTLPTSQPVQPGPDTIDNAVDERPTDAVYRNGQLWFVATADYFDGVNHWTAARYTQVLTSANGLGPTAANDLITAVPAHYFMPGVGIAGNGSAFLVATRSSASENPTSVVALVVPNLGFADFIDLEASTEPYDGERWGDYVGVAADPSGSGAVWVAHELAAAGGGWRTSVARIVSDNAVPGAPGAVIQSQVVASTLGATVPVRTSWGPAVDAGSGVASYLVERSDDGGGYVGVRTTSTFVTQPLLVGHLYRYRITAIDAVGNAGAPTYGPLYRPTLYQSNTSATVYTSGWGSSTSSSFSGGSTKYSSTAGKYATFTATNARSISIIATKAASRGSFKVYVDGVFRGTVRTYSTITRFRQLVYQFNWAAPGTHRIRVIISGTAGHPRVDLDAFVVLR